MKIKNLKPFEIITTRDFPVHNEHILKIYFKICKHGNEEILPLTPVIPLSVGIPLLSGKTKKDKEYNQMMKKFLKENKKVKYIMCDGSHKTTALTLTHKPIHAVILKTNSDMKEFRELVKTGEVFSMAAKKTIKDELKEKANHLRDADFFETVKDKTNRMAKEKVIPNFMIDYYKRLYK
ncbi:hypothetical protein HOD29_06275 [archaeon]|jgi:hypothetical protein|nr:hypothetical protein [archaeon]